MLMPGSGDSVQALKAGIMEIPDVIAVNKMDHPAAKTMLNEVRSILALDRERAWRPPILLTEAIRGENVPELWAKIEEHRSFLESKGLLEASAAEPRGEVFAVATSRASSICRRRSPRSPSCAGCSTRCRERKLDPLSAVREILGECAELKTRTTPTLTDIETARADRRDRPRHARLLVRDAVPTLGPSGAPEGREHPAHRRVQDRGAVNVIASLTPTERAAGVVAANGEPRPGSRVGGPRSRDRRDRLHAAGLTDGEVDATRNYGARVEAEAAGFDESLQAAEAVIASSGATFIHAFEDERVIAGQGTMGLELTEQLAGSAPWSSRSAGGLASGIAIALQALRPDVRLVGMQAEAVSPFRGGDVHGYTIAEDRGQTTEVP